MVKFLWAYLKLYYLNLKVTCVRANMTAGQVGIELSFWCSYGRLHCVNVLSDSVVKKGKIAVCTTVTVLCALFA